MLGAACRSIALLTRHCQMKVICKFKFAFNFHLKGFPLNYTAKHRNFKNEINYALGFPNFNCNHSHGCSNNNVKICVALAIDWFSIQQHWSSSDWRQTGSMLPIFRNQLWVTAEPHLAMNTKYLSKIPAQLKTMQTIQKWKEKSQWILSKSFTNAYSWTASS